MRYMSEVLGLVEAAYQVTLGLPSLHLISISAASVLRWSISRKLAIVYSVPSRVEGLDDYPHHKHRLTQIFHLAPYPRCQASHSAR